MQTIQKVMFLFVPRLLRVAVFAIIFWGVVSAPVNAATEWHIVDNTMGGDCSTIGTWDAFNKTCMLTQDLSQGIIIDNNDVILDGNGHTVTGTGAGNGVYLSGTTGVVIRNLNVKNFNSGIFLKSSNNNTLINNVTNSNNSGGIVLSTYSIGNMLENNTANSNKTGIWINFASSNNTLIGNATNSNETGIFVVTYSNGNTLTNHTIGSNKVGIFIDYSSNNNSIYNNTLRNNNTQTQIYNSSNNTFNTASPVGGNYWSNYDTPQEGCNDTNLDHFCDSPHLFQGGQDNLPWTTQDGWKNPTTDCTVNCYSNVLFLPGHQASRLYQNSVLFEDRLWEPNIVNVSDFSALALSPTTGESINDDIYTKDIIDESYIELQGFNVYKKFIDFMDTKEDEGLFEEWGAVPYDWRLDFDQLLSSGKVIGGTVENPLISYTQATSSPYIFQELERLVDSSRNGKVTLITHSNGGLLAKYLLGEISNPLHPYHYLYTQIDKVIMVVAPQVGTPKAIEGLLHGDSTQLGVKEWGIIIDEAQSREFAENMQSAYNLLPSNKYFDMVQSPIIEFDPDVSNIYDFPSLYGTEITTPEAFSRFLLGDNGLRTEPNSNDEEAPNVLKSLFLDKARATHSTLDSWIPPPHIEVIQIAGWGIKTIKGIRYDDCDIVFCSDTLSTLDRKILRTQQGDGTVVLPSAIAMEGVPNTETYYVDIREHNKRGILNSTRNRDHANILEIESLQEFIKNVILDTRTLTEDVYTTEPAPKAGDTLIDFSLHSPVALHLYDSSGKHTGIISNSPASTRIYEATIPNSYYEEHGGVKYAGVSGATTTTLVLRGEDLGTFTLNIEESLADKIIAQASFTNIPVMTSTTATLSLGSVDTMTTLAMDIDGDGIVDATLTGNEQAGAHASIEILTTIFETLNIQYGLKRDITEKLKQAEKEIKRQNKEKAVKKLDDVIIKLNEEIKKNTKQEEKGKEDKEQKISSEDAMILIKILQTIKKEMV